MPLNAFISYSHLDEKYLKALHKHFVVLKREGLLNAWSDHHIRAGDEFDPEIKSNLQKSDLFLALISPDYLDSPSAYEKEFEYALMMHKEGKIRILPIIVEPCGWKFSPFKKFRALPKDGKAISEWSNANNAYLDIVNELRKILKDNDNTHTFEKKSSDTKSVSTRRVRLQRDFDAIDKLKTDTLYHEGFIT